LDGEDGFYNALIDFYDLLLFDIMLPGSNGIEILKKIKKNNIRAKVIMVTVRLELEDKLLEFNKGVNDYIPKPFHINEVVIRDNAQLKHLLSLIRIKTTILIRNFNYLWIILIKFYLKK